MVEAAAASGRGLDLLARGREFVAKQTMLLFPLVFDNQMHVSTWRTVVAIIAFECCRGGRPQPRLRTTAEPEVLASIAAGRRQ